MPLTGQSHIRIARPSRDLAAAERFWVQGLGLSVLYRGEGDHAAGEHDLLMVGLPDAPWHLELVSGSALVDGSEQALAPRPTTEDLLVVYLDEPVSEALLATLAEHGGRRVASPNPYWNEWGATVEDPDGYRLVLCSRGWSNS
ncbi:VOC family protein [Kitasatospora kifunensis]|uniref:Catechol 2,3-dioxygenase-like lactoylglutathione lyase family enzyme n=1 Tax=Kitasatospora kifunensis TaxID=58351 RepID=A0A7W7VT12_KITKI|nr:VOC family protein [Kitasatospora kifunensis]MBB4921766.1 catechol 2,3-dioxygenase-like lactoylglutathione lyase family enzyme [Kitasatospora kifunensis]